MGKDKYIEIEGRIQLELISEVELVLGRELSEAEADRVRSIITERDVIGHFGE